MLCELTLAATPKMLSAVLFSAMTTADRPSLVRGQSTIHYFGVGSNMLRSKLASRGADGPIELQHFGPAVVRGYRLGFNFKGFAPLEPGIGSLEPARAADEVHGALATMSAYDYERLWRSEGGGQLRPEYEEVAVVATPYGSSQSVHAIALRARPHSRLTSDACPSERYLQIILDGAKELGLEPSYIRKLQAQRTQVVPPAQRKLAVHYLFFVAACFHFRLRWAVRALSSTLWWAYVPSTSESRLRRAVGATATTLLLAPGAVLGSLVRLFMWAFCIAPPPILASYAKLRPGCAQAKCA